MNIDSGMTVSDLLRELNKFPLHFEVTIQHSTIPMISLKIERVSESRWDHTNKPIVILHGEKVPE